MATYCRITGKSRGLPKPNYFPLLPPISPADAKRLCRITGKSYGLPSHHYIPVLVVAKPRNVRRHGETVGCEDHAETASSSSSVIGAIEHTILKDFRYVLPVLESNPDLLRILESKSTHLEDNNFVYSVHERKCGLVFPGRLEAAVRDGDVRDIMLAKHNDTLLLKLRKGVSVEVDVKEMSVDGVELYEGEGPSEAVQKRKKRKTHDANDWRRKIFEDKEKQADSEEERISEIKSKKIKVKSDCTIKETPVCGWKNVREGMIKLCANLEFDSTVGKMISELTDRELEDFVDVRGSLLTNFLPQSLKVESEFIDLSTSIPGIIQQPYSAGEQIIGFPIAAVIAPFQPFVAETDSALDQELDKFNADRDALQSTLEKQFHVLAQYAHILPVVVDVPELVKKIEELSRDTSGAVETELGIKLNLDTEKYIAGQFFDTPAGRVFVPGNVMETSVGPCFIPGFLLDASDGEIKFLPGRIVKGEDDELAATFVAGQMILTRDGQKFVQGQTVCTKEGVKFIPGQTVVTPDGVKFVPGQVIKNSVDHAVKFVPGHTIMTPEGPQFVPGQFTVRSDSGDTVFVSGQSVLNENSNWEFVPGKNVKTDEGYVFVAGKEVVSEDGSCQFVPGRVVIGNDKVERFVPGLTLDDRFLPGMQIETAEGVKFVEGMLVKDDDKVMFAAGRIVSTGSGDSPGIEFDCAKNQDDIITREILSDFGICFDSVSTRGITETDLFGHMIQSAQGVEFFPGDASGLPAGKVIPGRLVKGEEIRFIPGTMIDNKFIPGQFVTIGTEEKFIPGQVIETNDGPKFVPGQVLQTRSGPKFIPGQTMETEDGPKFIPGQIIETKSGPTFIPGQVIYTEEEGSRFVPGQVVDTAEGPRFVPGRVVETGDHVTFIPGQIVETEDGLKFVAPDLEDDLEGGYQFTVQAFEVAQEELKMIQRNSAPYNCSVGEMAIDSKTLQQFAEAGMAVGRQLPVDVPVVNIKYIPLTEVACEVAGRVNLDALYSVKLSHILSNLQQIKQSNVPISGEDINDENLRILLNLTLDCDNSAELLETLGVALENAIKSDLPNKLLIIDSLHAASVDLAVKVCDKNPGKLLTETARKVANKMDLDNLHSLKVTNILSNLQQIKQSHMTIACEELDNISDQHFKTLLNLALHSDDPAEFAETLGSALEDILKSDSDNKSEIIDSLQDLSADLSVKVCDKKPGKALSELALQVASKVDAQPESAKIGRILTNLLQIKQSNVAAIVDEINDEKLKTLVSLALQCTNTSEFLETVGKALEQAITSDEHNKLPIIDSLNTFTADLAVKVHEKKTNQVFNEMARQVANKVDLDPLSSLKLSHILSNLQKIKLSNLILDYENIEDSNAKMLANLAAEYDSPEFLETFGNALEKLMKSEPNKSQVVDNLYALSIDLTSKVRRTSKAFNEAALQVASEVDVDSVHSTKLRHILSNLQQIKQSNIALANEEIYDENLKNLLNLAQDCDTSADFLQTVGHALEQVIKSDPEKLHAIDSLHALSEDLASKVRDKKSKRALLERSNQIAQKVDLPVSAKLGHILSNLQQIKKSGGPVTYENIKDDNLKQLVSLAMDCDTTTEFLETVGNTLEHVIKSELGDKLCLVDSLHTASVDLLAEARNLKSGNALSEVAKNVARKVKLDDEVNRVKLSNILSNLQQIKKSAVLAIDDQEIDNIRDDGFKTLLNLALECDDSTEFLETLSNALEQMIKSNPSGNKLGVIDSLHSLSSSLASKVCDKDPAKLLAEVASKLAKTVGVDSVQAVKLTNILSNLKQLRKFNIIPEIENNDRFKYLLDLALHCEDDSSFPETLGLALEKLIKSDFENKLRVIDSLHDFSVEVVSKVGDQSRNAMFTQTASKLAQKINIDELHALKVANIFSNVKQLKQSGVPVVLECVKNENFKNLLNVALQNDIDELSESLANALEKIIEADKDKKLDIIDSLHTLSTDVVRSTNNEFTRAAKKARKLAKNANLDPLQVTKLTNIFTNLQQIKKSGVPISKAAIENADEKFQTILNLVSEANGLDFSETLGSALKKLFKCEGNKSPLIDALHDLSVDLAVNTNKESETRVLSQMARSLAKKMNLQGEKESAKLTNIMSVLQQVSKSTVTADDVKKIPDKKFKQLVNLALKSDTSEFMQIMGRALEKVIEADPENASQVIDTLHMQSATCAAKLLNTDVTKVIAQSTAKLAKKIKVDGLNSLKLTNILKNLQELGNADLGVVNRELKNVTDEKFRSLVCEALEDGNLEKLSLVLESTIKSDLDNKCDVIESLHSLSSEFAQKTIDEVPSSLIMQRASEITKKIPCSLSQSTKLGQILANLQRITESSLDVSNGEVKDKHLKQLLKLASECMNSEEVLDTLANSLERVLETNIADKDRLIESLHALTIDLLSKAKDKENNKKLEGTVVKIAQKVDLDDKSRGKLSNVISNLIGIRSNKNVKLNFENIEDENLITLVKFALESSKPELLENLSDALERAIIENIDNKTEVIDSLHTLSSDLALQIRQESANQRVSQVASQLAAKIDVDKPHSLKLGHILSNLQQIKYSNAVLSVAAICDENLRKLIAVSQGCEQPSQLLDLLSKALEQTVASHPDKLELINTLHASSAELAVEARQQTAQRALESKVNKIGAKVDLDQSYVTKLGHILTNLEQIKNANVSIPVEIEDQNLKDLLNLALIGNDSVDFLETVSSALEQTLLSNAKNKTELVDSLHALSSDLAIQVQEKESSNAINVMSQKVAKRVHVGRIHATKINQILSNLQQSNSNGIMDEQVIDNENLKNLLTLASECQNPAELLQTLGDALEQAVNLDPSNKLQMIDSLHASTIDLAVKSCFRKETKAVTRMAVKVAENVEKTVDALQMTKLSNILTNLRQIKDCEIAISKAELDDTDQLFKVLLNSALEKNDSNFTETVGNVLEQILKSETGNKSELVDTLHALSVDWVVKVSKKVRNDVLPQMARSLANKLQLDDVQAAKLTNIMTTLEQVKHSNIGVDEIKKISDKPFKQMLNLVLTSSSEDFADNLYSSLEQVVKADPKNAAHLIDSLHNQSVDIMIKILDIGSTKAMADSALKIAKELNVDELNSVKLFNILSNVKQIKDSDPKLVAEGMKNIADEKFKTVLNGALKSGGNAAVSRVLEEVIKYNLDNKLDVIESLHSLSSDFAIKTADTKPSPALTKIVSQITEKIKGNAEQSMKILHILADLQQIKESNVDYTDSDIKDKHLKQLLKLAAQCKNPEELAQTFGTALGKILSSNISIKDKLIESLHVSTIDLVNKVKQKAETRKFEETATKMVQKMNLDNASCGKLSRIISNLTEIQSEGNVNVKNIEDENLKALVKAALDSSKPKLLENLSQVLEHTILENVENKLQVIDSLHTLSANLALQRHQGSVNKQVTETASQLAAKTSVGDLNSLKLGHILSNLQQIKQSNADIPLSSISDENLKQLLTVSQKCDNPLQLLEFLGDALELAIFSDSDKPKLIDTLHASSAQLAVEARQQTAHRYLKKKTDKIAKKLNLSETHSVKLTRIFINLQQIKDAGIPVPTKIENQHLKTLVNLALKSKSQVDFLETVSAALEQALLSNPESAVQLIDSLDNLSSDIVVLVEEKKSAKAVIQTAHKLAEHLEVDKVHAAKLSQILTNLQKMKSVDCIPPISNEHLKTLINVVSKCQNPNELLNTLGNTLENVVKSTPSDKLRIIDDLHTLTVDLVAESCHQNVTKMAEQVAKTINFDPACSAKLSQILSNIQQIQSSDYPINDIKDETLKNLVKLASTCNNPSDLLQNLGSALEKTIVSDSRNKTQAIDSLHAATIDLAVKLRDQKATRAITNVAHQVANNINQPACAAKLNQILANVQQIKQSNISVNSAEVGNEHLQKLLTLACKSDPSEVLDILGNALEQVLQSSGNKSQLIDALHMSSVDLSVKLSDKKSNKSLTQMARHVADKVNLDTLHSVKLGHILSNLQQILQSNVSVSDEEIKDKTLKTLMNLASECENNTEFLETAGKALERAINSDPSNKVKLIDSLHTATVDLAVKVRNKKPNKVLLLKSMIKGNVEPKHVVIDKLISIFNEHETAVCAAFQHMCQENPEFVDKVLENIADTLKSVKNEKEAVDALHRAIIKAVTETSESKVQKALNNKKSDDFNSLVNDAVGLAKALGLGEVVNILNDVLKDGNCMKILAKDAIVMEVLKRLTVMRQLAETRPNLGRALKELHTDPYAARSDPRLRELVRESAMLMVIPEESLVLRSSADIPSSILFSDNTLAVEDFMVKTRQCGATFLILKKGLQAVIPREAARDVLTGQVPYTVLDENGIHYFKPLHVFNALKLPKFATNRFSNYTYIHPALKNGGGGSSKSYSQTRGSLASVEDFRKTPSRNCSDREVIMKRRFAR